ncbi:MAG: ATP-dependent Clp protease proteolytic subunit [Sedimentisphaerales bacterium]|nr:ATP-dependent Clp protease proteolytic subunit [Sedimentisphaerales bacterium]
MAQNMQKADKEVYIRFMAPVIPITAHRLLQLLDIKIREGYTKIHLLISSPGGSVFHGLAVHNFIKGCPVEIDTYNFGSVDSIGVIIFCAGTNRFCVPHARFLIHGVRLQVQGNNSYDEKQLEEHLKGLQIDQKNIARVIADTTGKDQDQVEQDMHNRTTLNPEEARDYGLVQAIKSQLFPANAEFHSIDDPTAGLMPPKQLQQIIPVQMPQATTEFDPHNENYTSWFDTGFTYTSSES